MTTEPLPPNDQRLVLLTNIAMRARRRPVAIAIVWGYELALAAAITWPASSFVGGAYGGHPDGDGPLFRPGGLALSDMLLRARPFMSALGSHVSLVAGIGIVLGLLPLALLIVEIAHVTPSRNPPPLRLALPRAWAAFPRFFTMLLLVGVAQGLVLGAGVIAGGLLSDATARSLGEARSQQLGAVVFFLFAAATAALGILHDIARAATIRFEVGAIRALQLAANAMRRSFFATSWSWGSRALVGWLLVVIAAMVSSRLGGRGGAALFAMALLHQLVILSRVALRASWIAKALRVVDGAHDIVSADAPADAHPHTDANANASAENAAQRDALR